MAPEKLLSGKLDEGIDEAQYCTTATSELHKDRTYSPPSTSKPKKKRRNVMELDSKKKKVSKKSKRPKSKDAQVQMDDSKTVSITRKRTRISDLFDDIEAEFSVKERAHRLLDHLGYELPHFVKCMLPSNVAHGFWLHLPKQFCIRNLPNHDTSITLEDEWGNEYRTSYLLDRYGLSAGWRGFSISHRLLKGDILMFHLIAPCKLKVHIVRVHGPDVVNAALCLVDMNASGGRADAGPKKENRKRRKPQFVEPFLLEFPEPLVTSKGKRVPSPVSEQVACQLDGLSSEVEVVEGDEVRNQPKSNNNLCCPEASFLHDHSRKSVTCM